MVRVDHLSWNFGPPDQFFRRTKISVTGPGRDRVLQLIPLLFTWSPTTKTELKSVKRAAQKCAWMLAYEVATHDITPLQYTLCIAASPIPFRVPILKAIGAAERNGAGSRDYYVAYNSVPCMHLMRPTRLRTSWIYISTLVQNFSLQADFENSYLLYTLLP